MVINISRVLASQFRLITGDTRSPPPLFRSITTEVSFQTAGSTFTWEKWKSIERQTPACRWMYCLSTRLANWSFYYKAGSSTLISSVSGFNFFMSESRKSESQQIEVTPTFLSIFNTEFVISFHIHRPTRKIYSKFLSLFENLLNAKVCVFIFSSNRMTKFAEFEAS